MARSTAQAALEYDYLSSDERTRIVESHLLALEREHFSLTQIATDSATTDRVTFLETEIRRLRELRDGLTSATPTSV